MGSMLGNNPILGGAVGGGIGGAIGGGIGGAIDPSGAGAAMLGGLGGMAGGMLGSQAAGGDPTNMGASLGIDPSEVAFAQSVEGQVQMTNMQDLMMTNSMMAQSNTLQNMMMGAGGLFSMNPMGTAFPMGMMGGSMGMGAGMGLGGMFGGMMGGGMMGGMPPIGGMAGGMSPMGGQLGGDPFNNMLANMENAPPPESQSPEEHPHHHHHHHHHVEETQAYGPESVTNPQQQLQV